MAEPPRIDAEACGLEIGADVLEIEDVPEVVTKWSRAFPALARWARALRAFVAETNVALEWLDARLAGPPARRVIDVGGAARGSAPYLDAIEAAALTEADVLAGLELDVVGIAAEGLRGTTETFAAELVAGGGARWFGPLAWIPYGPNGIGIIFEEAPEPPAPEEETAPVPPPPPPPPPNGDPVARAGEDVTIAQGGTTTLDGSRSVDPDGDIVAFEWREAGAVVGSAATLVVSSPAAGTRTFALRVADALGAWSVPDTVRVIALAPAADTAYARAAQPRGALARVTRNSAAAAHSLRSARRQVTLPGTERLVLSRGARVETDRTTYDVTDLVGRVQRRDLRTEREAMAAFTDADTTYGIRDYAGGGRQLVRSSWSARTFVALYNTTSELTIGSGQGRQSNDDRYVVLHRVKSAQLICIDMTRGVVVGSMGAPAGYAWASITPLGAWILVAEADGIYRYTRSFGARTQISAAADAGDAAVGADGREYFVQSGAIARRIDIAAATSLAIDTGGQGVAGGVSGATLVAGYVACTWRVGAVHELATMNLADGAAMWSARVPWTTLPAAVETRPYAVPAAVPSVDGRRIVLRYDSSPGADDFDLYLVS